MVQKKKDAHHPTSTLSSSVAPKEGIIMTSAEPRRRRDLKAQDREKSLSPLDKDHLKQRCLERVRTERSRLMARMRGRQGGKSAPSDGAADDGACADSPLAAGAVSAQGAAGTLSAREILRQGLSELAGGNSRHLLPEQQQHPNRKQTAAVQPPPRPLAGQGVGGGAQHGQPSPFLSAIEEENANYLDSCGAGRRRPRPPTIAIAGGTPPDAPPRAPMATSLREDCQDLGDSDGALMVDDSRQEAAWQQQQQPPPPQKREPEAMVEDELGWGEGEDYCDDERLLSPEEYLEMMQYIEEACREEGLQAEAELLRDYEETKRLEEEEFEYAIASGLDGVGGSGQAEAVLCPVCKRDYLLQAGPPSASIVCACGFRLDTAGDRLGLEHLRQQLADTYSQHRASCSADPSFAVEGPPGADVLWSSCEGCGFARVVI